MIVLGIGPAVRDTDGAAAEQDAIARATIAGALRSVLVVPELSRSASSSAESARTQSSIRLRKAVDTDSADGATSDGESSHPAAAAQ